MNQVKISDGVVALEMPYGEFSDFVNNIKVTQDRLMRILTGHSYVNREIAPAEIEDILFELEENSEYLKILLKSKNEMAGSIQTTMFLLSKSNKKLTAKQVDGYRFYQREYHSSNETVTDLFTDIEHGEYIEHAKKIIYKKEMDLNILYASIQKISDKQYVAVLQLQSMLTLAQDTLQLLKK